MYINLTSVATIAVAIVERRLTASTILAPTGLSPTNPDYLLQIGVGGLLCLLILREVFAFINKRYPNTVSQAVTAAEKPIEYWQHIVSTTINDALDRSLIPTLREMQTQQHNDTELLRDRLYGMANMLQTLISYWESTERRGKPR